MNNTYLIQKLIIELELESEQAYHRIASHIQSNLYEPLLKELDKVLTEYLKDEHDYLVIEKLEVELEPFFDGPIKHFGSASTQTPVEERISQNLIAEVKHGLSELLKTANFPSKEDKGKHQPTNQDPFAPPLAGTRPAPEQPLEDATAGNKESGRQATPQAPVSNESDEGSGAELSPTRQERKMSKEVSGNEDLKQQSTEKDQSKQEDAVTAYRTSELDSIKHYLLTGQFLLGVELSAEEAQKLAEQEAVNKHLKEWVANLPALAQQYLVLKRVAWQFSPKTQASIFQDPAIKIINQSFPSPIPISQQLGILSKDRLLDSSPETSSQWTVSASNQPPTHAELQEEQAYYVKNAGIVIVAPYLPSFFYKSGLLDDTQKGFKSEYAAFYAAHLLEYLANKSTVETEDTAWLNKLLCGLPLSTPIPTKIDIEESDKALSTRLLLQVSKQWDIKIGEKIDYLRTSFFIRDGKLIPPNPSWVLAVDSKLADGYLFEKLPWTFNRIKLPWMSEWLLVDWD